MKERLAIIPLVAAIITAGVLLLIGISAPKDTEGYVRTMALVSASIVGFITLFIQYYSNIYLPKQEKRRKLKVEVVPALINHLEYLLKRLNDYKSLEGRPDLYQKFIK